jgi:hypothetical protein
VPAACTQNLPGSKSIGYTDCFVQYVEVMPTEEKCSVYQLHPSDWVVCAVAQASSHSSLLLSGIVGCMADKVIRIRLICALRFPMCFQKKVCLPLSRKECC